MKAFFLTEGTSTSPASRIRVYNHLERLSGRAGLEARSLSFTSEAYCRRLVAGEPAGLARRVVERFRQLRVYSRLQAEAQGADLVFIQRVLPPRDIIPRLAAVNPSLVYDFDDAVYLGSDAREVRFRRIMRTASAVLAVSAAAAGEAVRRGAEKSKVTVLPSPVDCVSYRVRPAGAERETFTVGWIGSPSTTPYLEAIWPELAGFAREKSGVRFLFLGARAFDTGELGGRVRFESWSPEAEKQFPAGMDAGLMPLVDDPWCRGKGGYKLIQYMAAGVACLASPVGANLEVVEEGRTGFFAREAGDWRRNLERLADDPALCDSLGGAGRRRAEEQYDYAVLSDKFLKVLEAAHQGACLRGEFHGRIAPGGTPDAERR